MKNYPPSNCNIQTYFIFKSIPSLFFDPFHQWIFLLFDCWYKSGNFNSLRGRFPSLSERFDTEYVVYQPWQFSGVYFPTHIQRLNITTRGGSWERQSNVWGYRRRDCDLCVISLCFFVWLTPSCRLLITILLRTMPPPAAQRDHPGLKMESPLQIKVLFYFTAMEEYNQDLSSISLQWDTIVKSF